MEVSYLYALGANICFATGTIVFTIFTRKIGSVWMNASKAIIATILFYLTVEFFYSWHEITNMSLFYLFTSGLIGLCIGDIFLLKAFQEIGPARTLMVFGIQPVTTGTLSYYFLGQETSLQKLWAISLFIICIFIFSFENFKANRSWGVKGLSFALIGIVLDSTGVIWTRLAFNDSPELIGIEANLYRGLGAVFGFVLISLVKPFGLISNFKALNINLKALLLIGCVLGTYTSLFLYLEALKVSHLASLSGITITSPLFASLLESIIDKKWPSKYLLLAFVFFAMGVLILTL